MCTKAMDDGAIVDSAVEFAITAIEASGHDRPFISCAVLIFGRRHGLT